MDSRPWTDQYIQHKDSEEPVKLVAASAREIRAGTETMATVPGMELKIAISLVRFIKKS